MYTCGPDPPQNTIINIFIYIYIYYKEKKNRAWRRGFGWGGGEGGGAGERGGEAGGREGGRKGGVRLGWALRRQLGGRAGKVSGANGGEGTVMGQRPSAGSLQARISVGLTQTYDALGSAQSLKNFVCQKSIDQLLTGCAHEPGLLCQPLAVMPEEALRIRW